MKLNAKILSSPYAVSAVSALVTFIVYLPSLGNDFVTWDDNVYIYTNEHIKYFDLDLIKWSLSDLHVGNWHPLTWISHAVDYAVWGMNPAGHHLTNILLHALNTFLVALLAVRLIEAYRAGKSEAPGFGMSDKSVLFAGAATGLLFGLHPVHVESVAWVSERKDVLYAFFFLLALFPYIRYASEGEASGYSRHRYGRYISVFLLFFFAALSKPMAVTFPAVLLILDWFPFQRLQTAIGRRRAMLEKIPFFITCAMLTYVAVFAQKTAHAVPERLPIPLSARIMNAAKALMDYLINMLWPADLMPLYPHPYWDNPVLTSAQYVVPALSIVFISACCILLFTRKRQKLWLAVWTAYVIMLLPVLGIIQVGAQGMADRYTYLPSAGPFLIMGIAAGLLGQRIIASDSRNLRKMAFPILVAAFSLCTVLLTHAAIRQIQIWKDGVTLWSHELDTLEKQSSQNWFVIRTAYVGRGYAYMRSGNYQNAIHDFSNAILLKPDADAAYYQQRGIAYARLGRLEEGIQDFTAAISINPKAAELYYNRGTAFARRGSYREAVDDLTKAISMSTVPRAEYFFNRGLALLKLGKREEGALDIAAAGKLKSSAPR